jgi:hypothetical protein
VCACASNDWDIFSDSICCDIPEQYQGVKFDPTRVPTKMGIYLSKLHTDISLLQLRHKNIIICSPHHTGKTIFAYSCIQALFRKNIRVYPFRDIDEISGDMRDFSSDIYLAPYLFVKIPASFTTETLVNSVTLIDRRVRRGLSTILFFSGHWSRFSHYNGYNPLSAIRGDGSYTTLDVRDFSETTNA